MASPYISSEKAKELALAELLNVATDDDGEIDEARLTLNVAAVNSYIDDQLSRRFEIPLTVENISPWLTIAAKDLLILRLCVDDAATTDLIKERAATARKDVAAYALNKVLNGPAGGADSATKIATGPARLIGNNERVFKR